MENWTAPTAVTRKIVVRMIGDSDIASWNQSKIKAELNFKQNLEL